MTPTITEIRALLERVEGATEACRELDLAIHNTFWPAMASVVTDVGRLTCSIDAAVEFSQAVLPGWLIIEMGQDPLHGLWFCCLYNIDTKSAAESSELDRPALALIAATLRAKIAEMETTHAE